MNIPNKIIVHHSASPRDTTSLQQIDQWHKERGFNKSQLGWFVGYHFIIFADGHVVQTRADWEAGCHTLGQNWQSIGICLTGNFDKELPTPHQESALASLFQSLSARFPYSVTEVFPHRAFQPKDCYGTLLKDDWAEKVMLGVRISYLSRLILELKKKLGIIK